MPRPKRQDTPMPHILADIPDSAQKVLQNWEAPCHCPLPLTALAAEHPVSAHSNEPRADGLWASGLLGTQVKRLVVISIWIMSTLCWPLPFLIYLVAFTTWEAETPLTAQVMKGKELHRQFHLRALAWC